MTPYPLAWPETMPRHKGTREAGQFRTSLSVALENAQKSLRAFATDTGIGVSDIVFSSNYGGVGLMMQHSTSPADPGVALWFMWDGAQRCIAVDRYSRIEANLQAIHHVLEADRTKIRHGSLAIVRASYRGMIALPAAAGPRPWREVLGFPSVSMPTTDAIERTYRTLAKERHPDAVGGSTEAMAELNAAKAAALKEIDN